MKLPPPPRLVVQRLRRGPEDLGGAGFVVVHRLQRSQDQLLLTVVERGAHRQHDHIGPLGGRGTRVGVVVALREGDESGLRPIQHVVDAAPIVSAAGLWILRAVKREEVDLLLTGMRLKRPASSP